MADDFTDRNAPARPGKSGNLSKKNHISVPGAIASGTVNGLLMALILAVPGLGLPFITTGFSAVVVPLLVGAGANVMSTFMQMGYSTHRIRHFAKVLESGASAFALWSLWKYYPFDFSSIAPGLDSWLPWVFGALAVFSGISGFVNLIKAIKGPSRKDQKQSSDDGEDD